MSINHHSLPSMVLLLLPTLSAADFYPYHIDEQFEDIKTLVITDVNSPVHLSSSQSNQVSISIQYQSDKTNYLPVIENQQGVLTVGNNGLPGIVKNAEWRLAVPDHITVQYETSSGQLFLKDTHINLTSEMSSGSVKIENASGSFEVDLASGQVQIRKSSGMFKVDCASCDIKASEIEVTDDSTFESSSGDVSIKLASSAASDLSVTSSSGQAVLDYNDHPLSGSYTVKRRDIGRAKFPTDYQYEERTVEYNQTYIVSTFNTGDSNPDIRINTASGKATLKE